MTRHIDELREKVFAKAKDWIVVTLAGLPGFGIILSVVMNNVSTALGLEQSHAFRTFTTMYFCLPLLLILLWRGESLMRRGYTGWVDLRLPTIGLALAGFFSLCLLIPYLSNTAYWIGALLLIVPLVLLGLLASRSHLGIRNGRVVLLDIPFILLALSLVLAFLNFMFPWAATQRFSLPVMALLVTLPVIAIGYHVRPLLTKKRGTEGRITRGYTVHLLFGGVVSMIVGALSLVAWIFPSPSLPSPHSSLDRIVDSLPFATENFFSSSFQNNMILQEKYRADTLEMDYFADSILRRSMDIRLQYLQATWAQVPEKEKGGLEHVVAGDGKSLHCMLDSLTEYDRSYYEAWQTREPSLIYKVCGKNHDSTDGFSEVANDPRFRKSRFWENVVREIEGEDPLSLKDSTNGEINASLLKALVSDPMKAEIVHSLKELRRVQSAEARDAMLPILQQVQWRGMLLFIIAIMILGYFRYLLGSRHSEYEKIDTGIVDGFLLLVLLLLLPLIRPITKDDIQLGKPYWMLTLSNWFMPGYVRAAVSQLDSGNAGSSGNFHSTIDSSSHRNLQVNVLNGTDSGMKAVRDRLDSIDLNIKVIKNGVEASLGYVKKVGNVVDSDVVKESKSRSGGDRLFESEK